jgi:hypothetical protein
MHQKVAVAIAGGLVVFLTALAAGVIVKWSLEQPKRDGRSWRCPAERRYSIRRNQFAVADRNLILYGRWFRDTFRCSWQSFNRIVSLVENEWDSVHCRFFTMPDFIYVNGLQFASIRSPIFGRLWIRPRFLEWENRRRFVTSKRFWML